MCWTVVVTVLKSHLGQYVARASWVCQPFVNALLMVTILRNGSTKIALSVATLGGTRFIC